MKRALLRTGIPVAIVAVVFALGPQSQAPTLSPQLPSVPSSAEALEEFIASKERRHRLKRDNEARIFWADSSRGRTEYSVVYLHGFSASQEEGDPVHEQFATEFGSNLFLARIADHGVDTTEALLQFTADRAWESAKEALAVGNAIGEKTILISTSTGGTLALRLAAVFPEKVHALINLSPNIAINNPAAFLLNGPWGLQIARMVKGGKYNVTGAEGIKANYWNAKYRLEGVVQLQELIESTMDESTFEKITQPSLTLYYYRDEDHQDPEVMVSAMLEMHESLGTDPALKDAIAVPTAGAHVIGGGLSSKDTKTVYRHMREFAIEKLKLSPAGNDITPLSP